MVHWEFHAWTTQHIFSSPTESTETQFEFAFKPLSPTIFLLKKQSWETTVYLIVTTHL